MRVYAPLTEMFQAVRDHGLVLNPHNTEAMPRDGRKPNEQDILIAGAYNLGFIGIGSSAFADELLDWWGVRLERDCIVDPERGFFVDQRWIDLVPGHGGVASTCCATPASTSPTGTSPTRPVSERDGTLVRQGRRPAAAVPLQRLRRRRARTCSPSTRTASGSADEPDLARLCAAYAAELIDERRPTTSRTGRTRYDTSASGHPARPAQRAASTAT